MFRQHSFAFKDSSSPYNPYTRLSFQPPKSHLRTEPDHPYPYDQNTHRLPPELTKRFTQIKTKYTSRRASNSTSYQQNLPPEQPVRPASKIREDQSPLNILQNSANRAYTPNPKDPRIQNIDKINQKIRKILDNIDSNTPFTWSAKDQKKNHIHKAIQNSEPRLEGFVSRKYDYDTFQARVRQEPVGLEQNLRNGGSGYSNSLKSSQHIGHIRRTSAMITNTNNSGASPAAVRAIGIGIDTQVFQESLNRKIESYKSPKNIDLIRNNLSSHKNTRFQFDHTPTKALERVNQFMASHSKNRPGERIKSCQTEYSSAGQENLDFDEQSLVIAKPLSSTETKDESLKVIAALNKQVQLDEEYRNKKYAFKQIKDDRKLNNLIGELKKQFGQRLFSIFPDQKAILSEFELTEDEYNPFYTCRETTDYCDIVKAFRRAYEYWNSSIAHAFSRQSLEKQSFGHMAFGSDSRGLLNIQDMVRLINLQSDTFLRRRDLVLIYRRLASEGSLNLDNFYRFLSA